MKERHEATRGLFLIFAAIVVLAIVVSNARHHFSVIATDAPVADTSPDSTDAPRRRKTFVPHEFDRTPIDPRRTPGAVDYAAFEGRRVHVRGWIITPEGLLGEHVIAIVDGDVRIEITPEYGKSRPDVAKALNNENLQNSGIDATFSPGGLKRGDHRLTFAVASKDGRTLFSLATSPSFRIP